MKPTIRPIVVPPAPSIGMTRMLRNALRQEAEMEAAAEEAHRHELDADEAEALATRHAEARRARRSAAEHPDHEG